MSKPIQVLFVITFLLLGFAACAPVTTEVVSYPPPVDVSTPSPSPTQTMAAIDHNLILTTVPLNQTLTPAQATYRAQQPTQNAYCHPLPVFLLPIADAQGLDEDQIAGKLMELYLTYYQSPQAPNQCHIEAYRIDDVYFDERPITMSFEPKGDFMRVVLYSIKVPLIDNHPYANWGGSPDENNPGWLHMGNHVAIFRHDNGYTMQFTGP